MIARLHVDSAQLIAPLLYSYEVVSVVRKWVYRGLVSHADAETVLDVLTSYPITIVVDNGLLRRAYELATALNLPTAYDAQYLAVADRYECPFWTVDERLYNTIKGRFPGIHWVGSITPDS